MAELEHGTAYGKEIIERIYDARMIRTWYRDKPEGWQLISGLWSPLYIQLRALTAHPDILRLIGRRMSEMIRFRIPEATQLVGVAFAGIPIAVATSLMGDFPSAMTRKLPGVRSLSDLDRAVAEYGEHALVEGELKSGDRLVIVDDLVSGFDSKLIAAAQVTREVERRALDNVTANHVAVVFDREQGAQQAAEQSGMHLHALIRFRSEGLEWLKDRMSPREHEVIRSYLENPQAFQSRDVQKTLIREAQSA